jgi:CheY-like chemotaxis protein
MNSRPNVLVVDDDNICRAVIQHILKSLGIKTNAASNGLEAISALEMMPYDLVLMDILMPEMNGIEATKAICELWPEGPKIAIISDCSSRIYREQCLDAGAIEFLAKPAKITDIRSILERYLPEKRLVSRGHNITSSAGYRHETA